MNIGDKVKLINRDVLDGLDPKVIEDMKARWPKHYGLRGWVPSAKEGEEGKLSLVTTQIIWPFDEEGEIIAMKERDPWIMVKHGEEGIHQWFHMDDVELSMKE